MKFNAGITIRDIPTIGQMDKPVLFYDPSKVPDDFDGFDTNLKPVAKAWASILFGARMFSKQGGEEADAKDAHRVVIHNLGVRLPKGTYMVHERDLFRVVYTSQIDPRGEYLCLYVVAAGDIVDGDVSFEVGDGSTSSDSAPSSGTLWKDGF